MLRNGSYSAWYRTPQKEGTGIIVLNDGKITGGNGGLVYNGTYFQNGNRFSAVITTWREAPGLPSIFGIDNIDLTLTGTSAPTTASCTGTIKQAPDLPFEVTLIRVAD
jgi:hypothetical protein